MLGGLVSVGDYYIMIERISNNRKGSKAVTLFDYALININKPKDKPTNPSINKSVSIIKPVPTQQSASKS